MAYRLFIGNLPMNIKEREIDDLFYKYGKIKEIDIKTPPRPPAYAFITFDNEDDANDAVKGRDGYEFDGSRLRVEFAKGSRGNDRDRDRDRRENRGRKRTDDWRVLVSHLPKSTSWQDLKDFMRKAGDVIYADVDSYGDGVVDYSNEDDMENAIRKLDDVEFKTAHDSSYIRVKAANRGRERRRRSSSKDRHHRSRSRDGSHDRHRSRRDSRDDRKKSVSPSPHRSRDTHQDTDSPNRRGDDRKDSQHDSREDSPRRNSSPGSDRDTRRRHRSPSSSRDRSNGSGR